MPQFYLRNFAGPGDGTLGVFNLKASRFITPAKLKNQTAKSWLYGADGKAERHRASIEGAAAIAPLLRETRIWIEEEDLERTEATKRGRVAYKVSGSPLRLDLPFLRTVAILPYIADLMEWGWLHRRGLIDFDTFDRLSRRVPQLPHRRRH